MSVSDYVREKQFWFRMPPDGKVVAYFVLQLLDSFKYQLAVSRLFASTQKKGCKMSVNTHTLPINVVIVHSVNELTNHIDFLKSTSDFI